MSRLRAANPEFVAWLDGFRATFDAKLTYLRDYGTGKEWGKPVQGVAVCPKPFRFPAKVKRA